MIASCVCGYVIWWQRRPRNANEIIGLNPPARGQDFSIWWSFAIPLLVVAIIFPAAIIVIMAITLLDFLVISRAHFVQKLFK